MTFISRLMDEENRMHVASILCLVATILLFILKERIFGTEER